MKHNRFFIFFIALSLFIICCNKKNKENVNINTETHQLIKSYLYGVDTTKTITIDNDSILAKRFIVNFYRQNNYTSVWFNEWTHTQPCDSLYKIIKNSDDYGLISDDYHLKKIDSLFNINSTIDKIKINAIAEAELLLTDAFFTFAVHVNKGRLNKDSLTREWKGNEVEIDLATILKNALKNNSIHAAIDSLEPKNNEYKALKTALKNFKNEFKNTLQTTKRDYLRQIEMNMERWRYYKKPKDKTYAWINIPKFEMCVMEKDSLVMKSKVIVGTYKNPTPILHSTISYFLIYPYWNVPRKIAIKEILPMLKKKPDYLERKNFEVLDNKNLIDTTPINWKKFNEDHFPFRFRQRMGNDNALGVLKFYFNNKYGVYMHDTNDRKLFNLEDRALSHGCIRLEKFVGFAAYLIKNNSIRYPVDSLKYNLLQEHQKYVYLKRSFPIYINYFTIEVNRNNELIYFKDVYKRDEKMIKALYKG